MRNERTRYCACCVSVEPTHLLKSPVGGAGFVEASQPNSVTQISLPGAFRLRQAIVLPDRGQVLDTRVLGIAAPPGGILLREGIGVQVDDVVETFQPLHAREALGVLLARPR